MENKNEKSMTLEEMISEMLKDAKVVKIPLPANASGFCNETILSDDFPELPEGKTQITWTGGITAVEVTPRWWTL